MFKWMPSNDLIAQLAHVGWGIAVPLIFYRFHLPLVGIFGLWAYAALKEFVFDKYVEGQTFDDNIKDFAFYALGAGAAVLVIYL